MASNRGVVYVGPGKVEVRTIDYPKMMDQSWLGFFRQADKWNDCYIFPQ
jgi:hypothetical protein